MRAFVFYLCIIITNEIAKCIDFPIVEMTTYIQFSLIS